MKIIEWLNGWNGITAENDIVVIHCGTNSIRRTMGKMKAEIKPVILNWALTKVNYTFNNANKRWTIHIYTKATPNKNSYFVDNKFLK